MPSIYEILGSRPSPKMRPVDALMPEAWMARFRDLTGKHPAELGIKDVNAALQYLSTAQEGNVPRRMLRNEGMNMSGAGLVQPPTQIPNANRGPMVPYDPRNLGDQPPANDAMAWRRGT